MDDLKRVWRALGAVRAYVDDGDIPPDAVWDELVDAVQMLIVINETLELQLANLQAGIKQNDEF